MVVLEGEGGLLLVGREGAEGMSEESGQSRR